RSDDIESMCRSLQHHVDTNITLILTENKPKLALYQNSVRQRLRDLLDPTLNLNVCISIARGLIPAKLSTLIGKIFPQFRARPIIIEAANFLLSSFHEQIWLPRCNSVIDTEKRKGITTRLKKKK
ncbi:5999_t:CDS:1, partial [Funneliformis mosseae]